ncbi:hypothetical protein ES703_94512 [subsurface metagenome]
MVKTARQRTSKFKAKIISDVVKDKLDYMKDEMTLNYRSAIEHQILVEDVVRKLMKGTALMAPYMGYAKQIDKIIRRKSGLAQKQEIEIAIMSWKMRGLTLRDLKRVLTEIKKLHS